MRNAVTFGIPAVLLVGGLIAYSTGAIPEQNVGAFLAALCVIAPGPYAGWRVAQLVRSDKIRVALIALGVLVAALSAIPVYFALYPGEARYSGTIGNESKTLEIGAVTGGAYTLTVEGVLPEREGEVTAEYRLKIKNGDDTRTVDGEIWRRFGQVRVGRRGTAMQEHARTYDRSRIVLKDGAANFELAKLTTIDQLKVQLHSTLLPAPAFWAIAIVLCLIGALIEGKYGTEQVRALVSTMFVFSVSFAVIYPDQVSQSAFVRPAFGSAIGALFIAIFIGGIAAWVGRKILRPAKASE